MNSRFGSLFRTASALGLAALLAAPAAAQERLDDGDRVLWAAGAEGVEDFNVSAARRNAGFQLYAGADAAIAGMHMTGNFGTYHDTYGMCDAPLTGFCQWSIINTASGNFASFQFFEVMYAAGAPPSEWAKIRRVAPEAANATGGGYTSLMNFALFAGRAEWGPRDGTLGSLFAGVTSTNDGGCRDHTGFSNGFVSTGLQLLASNNCPETWAGGVWQGDRNVPSEGYAQLFQAQGADFTFDYWRVPEDLKADDPFLGSNFATYGESSDHYADILAGYGGAVPGGSGDPAFQGYPLGLVWRFDAFNFGLPALSGVTFWRATVINRSEDVWGTGIDYDSLYIGLWPGTGGTTGGNGGGQRYSNYYLPDLSLGLYHQSGVQGAGGPCGDPGRSAPGVVPCANSSRGYGHGGNAIIVLKSPIGDQRNKLFTRTAAGNACQVGVDPFCDPTHPLADDTITFNHGRMCGFGGCWATAHNVNDKRSFGVLSSTEDNTVDGQTLTPGSFAWRTFRNEGYPGVLGQYNKYVPGGWDYNNDGVNDTLFYDTCGAAGCVATDGDTMPGGHYNAYGNVGGVLAAGPFPLAAGDTTTFWTAQVADKDSGSTWAGINAAIDFYLNFFLGPSAPPKVSIPSTQIVSPVATGGLRQAPEVTLFFTEDPERWVDPFLSKLADDLEAAPLGTPSGDLVAANPGVVAAIRARALDNLERIEIYKSCNGGNTFTSDGDCVGDPASDQDGNPIGFGWEAYTVLDVDGNSGNIPNAFTDGNVEGGRTYLYVIIGKSRGANFLLNVPVTGGTVPDTVLFAPSIRNTLSRSTSEPNVVSVYVPASNQSGFQAAEATFSATSGAGSTVPFSLSFAGDVTAGNYRVTFANQFLVERDSNMTDEVVEQTVVRAQRVVTASASPADTTAIVRSNVYTREGAEVLPVAGTPVGTTVDTVNTDVFRTTDTYSGLGLVLTSGGNPFFVSQTLTGEAATPTSVFALSDFPGVTVNANNSVAGDFNATGETVLRGPALRERLGLTDADTAVPSGNANQAYAQWREQESVRAADGVGEYRLTWESGAFNMPEGVLLNLTNPVATEAEIQAALAGRPAALTGQTDAETAALIGVPQADLVPVRVPFTVRNETMDRDVEVAMVRRQNNTILLGASPDTIRIEVQPDEWVPGDMLLFIEDIEEDSTVGGAVVLGGDNEPIRVTHRRVTFPTAVVGCNNPRSSCNPVRALTRGQSGYIDNAEGDQVVFEYFAPFTTETVFDFDMVAPVTGDQITQVTDSALALVQVVPNPFVVFSNYQGNAANPRVLFTNMPPTGTLRIYTVSGQFAQEITWTPADLQGAGDLFYDLKTREGIDIASGLYLWVLTAPSDPTTLTSTPVRARGKFVVIRGSAR